LGTATDVAASPEPLVLARVEWPSGPGDTVANLPQIAGFVMSDFNPLVAEIAERCLRSHYGAAPADPARGASTGVVLASVRGDVMTVAAVHSALAEGRRVPPLLFFQSNPNAVVGHVTARWGLHGPVVCTSPVGDPLADGVAVAALLIEDGAATEVLVIAADLPAHENENDREYAVALLVAGVEAGEG
jgi:3-oxoacyl-(acyl-carrier-protein) synthase